MPNEAATHGYETIDRNPAPAYAWSPDERFVAFVVHRSLEEPRTSTYRGLKVRGLKGRHIEALVAEWRRQGLSDGTMRNRMAHLRWLAKQIGKPGIVRKDNASYGIGTGG